MNMLRILEFSWMFLMVLGFTFGTLRLLSDGLATAAWFYLLAVAALLFWVIRRRQRIYSERKRK